MWTKFKNLLLYGGTSRQDYLNVYADITEGNRINLLVFSGIVAIGMLVMVFSSLFDQSLVKNRAAYFIVAIICVLLVVLALSAAKTRPSLTYVALYIFIGVLFGFGIDLGTFVEPNELTVSFPVILFAAPLLFTDRPLRMNIAILVSIAVYFYLAVRTQDSVMLGYNRSNILPYGLISMVVSSYMMQIKLRRYALEYENRNLIALDQMTGLMNRRSYEQHISSLRRNGCTPGILICAMDVNGLKSVNDHIGHQSGDELLCEASECISKVFSPYGTCYRTGGDEFMAILDRDAPDAETLTQRLNASCAGFRKDPLPVLSISLGIVAAEAGSDIDVLVRDADQKMYCAKAAYYRQAGIDRRHGEC